MIIAVCQRGFLNLCEVFHIQLQWQRKWSKRSKNPHKHGIYRLLTPLNQSAPPYDPPCLNRIIVSRVSLQGRNEKRPRILPQSEKKNYPAEKDLLYGIGGHDYWGAWTRGANGRLAKGKIHCSCPMCRSKSYDDPTIRDKRAMGIAAEMLREYLREEDNPYERDDPQQTGRN